MPIGADIAIVTAARPSSSEEGEALDPTAVTKTRKNIVAPAILLRIEMIVTPIGRDRVAADETSAAAEAQAAKIVALPQLAQNFAFDSILDPQCVQYDRISANLYS